MREVVLDDNRFRVIGDIQRRNINPMAARIDTGPTGYSSFCQASVEEWHGMRGGIGVKNQKTSGTEQLYWSEGLNTSLDSGIIQGPKINTAGTFAKICVDIFDFDGSGSAKTYAYGDNLIAEWKGDTDWVKETVYGLATYVNAVTDTGYCYECTTAGTSGATHPAWPTTVGGTVEDNDVVWTCRAERWVTKEAGLDDPIDDIVVTDEEGTYAVVSSATAAYKSTDGTTWTALEGCKGYLAVLDNRLIGFYGKTVNYSPRGNIDGDWLTFKVSAYLGTVNGLFAGKLLTNGDPVLYLNTSEGLWAIDFWTQQIYKQEISFPPHDYAGYAAMYWNSYVWISTGAGIKKITPGMATDVGPDQDDGLPSGYQGAVFDMLGLSDWIIYCVNGGSSDDQKSSIFKRHGTIGGNQQIYTGAANKPIRCLHFSPSSMYTNGRLWWGEDTGIKYCMFPDFNADPTEISGYEFVLASGRAILSTFRPLTPFNKLALRVMAVTKGCDDTAGAERQFTIYYKVDDGDWETALGVFATSPVPTALEFADGAGLVFRTITFGIEGETHSSATTPELKSLMFGYLAGTKRLRGFTFPIAATQDNSEDIFSKLHTTQDKDELVKFYPSGNTAKTSYWVKITNLPENVHWDANRKEGEIQVSVEEIFRG